MNGKKIYIKSEFVTLNQFLKMTRFIATGGEAKKFLTSNKITINNTVANQRGKKIFEDDIVEINDKKFLVRR